MKFTDRLKTKTSDIINLTKEQFDKTFDYAKIKSDKIKEKIDAKIQEKAVLNLKAELAMRHKTFDDYTDEELEIMLVREKDKIIHELKNRSLVAALALLGLDFLV
ncbi:MAG: hypothetical protein IE885_08405 [Campylobacterales bacterium]|nr:hypothetical protein [Campylobacterales bacterium]